VAGPNPEHLEAVREGLLSFFHEAEMAGGLDAEPQLEPGEARPGHRFQPKPDTRSRREA
jgi:hypothetical protein